MPVGSGKKPNKDKECDEVRKLPKLKIMGPSWDVSEEIRAFEEGKYLPFCEHVLITIEGQAVSSYEQLVQLAAEDCYRDKEFLEVRILETIAGG